MCRATYSIKHRKTHPSVRCDDAPSSVATGIVDHPTRIGEDVCVFCGCKKKLPSRRGSTCSPRRTNPPAERFNQKQACNVRRARNLHPGSCRCPQPACASNVQRAHHTLLTFEASQIHTLMVQLNKENLPRVLIRYGVRWLPTGGARSDSVLLRPLSGSTHTHRCGRERQASFAYCLLRFPN